MKDGTYRSVCGLCHCSCGIIAEIRDGRLKSLQGDPDHPANRGYLCPKAAAIEELNRSPQRLTRPLKRTPEGLREVSWEEAYDYAASRLSAILEEHGPAGLMRCSGAPMNYDARDGFATLMKLCGSPNATGSSAYCMVPRVLGYQLVMGAKPEPDLERAQLILMWGANPKASNRMGNFCAYNGIQAVLDRARARGAEIIFLDPIRCESIREGDRWIPLRPGSDIFLALGMLREIIRRDLYHHAFVENSTLGFEALRNHLQPYTPELVQQKTGVPAGEVRALAERFAQSASATICDGNGLDMYGGTVYTVQAIALLLAITGRVDVPGGAAFLPFLPQTPMNDLDPRGMALKSRFPLFRDIPFPAVKEALLTGDPLRPRGMIVHHANPALINGNSARTWEALKKLDFLMVDDIFLTATAELADLVLPARTAFECYGYKAYTSFDHSFVAFSRPIFDAPGETKSVFEMEYEIGRRMGFGDRYPFRDDLTWMEYALAPSGISRQRLQEEQIVYSTRELVWEKYKTSGFATPSKKVELYSARMEAAGYSPLPVPVETVRSPKDAEDYPLTLTSRRPGGFLHTQLHNLPLAVAREPMPLVLLGPADAQAFGIREGDLVTIETPGGRGVFSARVKAEQGMGLLALDFGWGNPTDQGSSLNLLTSDSSWDPVSGGNPNRLFFGRILGVEKRLSD